MQRGFKGNVLLIELLIVILFFSVSAAIDLELFGAAHENGKRSRALSQAVIDCQDWAERIFAAAEPEKMLTDAGWTDDNGAYTLDKQLYTLIAHIESKENGAGEMLRGSVRAVAGQQELLALPLGRYRPGEESQNA